MKSAWGGVRPEIILSPVNLQALLHQVQYALEEDRYHLISHPLTLQHSFLIYLYFLYLYIVPLYCTHTTVVKVPS